MSINSGYQYVMSLPLQQYSTSSAKRSSGKVKKVYAAYSECVKSITAKVALYKACEDLREVSMKATEIPIK
jgi:hypothetical protein